VAGRRRAGSTLCRLTRDEAEREAERLLRQHPDRAAYRWFAREVGGAWSVVRVSVAHACPAGTLKPTVEAKPRPPQPDGSRPSIWRDLGVPDVGPPF
jgi:hypothetical protein